MAETTWTKDPIDERLFFSKVKFNDGEVMDSTDLLLLFSRK